MKYILKILKTDIKHFTARLLTAWCFILIIQLLMSEKIFSDINFVGQFDIYLTILLIVVAYLLISCISLLKNKKKADIIEKLLLFISVFFYALMCCINYSNILFAVSAFILITVVVIYCFDEIIFESFKISNKIRYMIYVLLALFFILFTGICTVLRLKTYSSPNYDMGLFSQMFHYMKTTLRMDSTSERDVLLSHFAVHVSPAFYLILPAYYIFSSPVTLQIMQVILIAAGIVPFLGICRNHCLTDIEKILAAVIYFSYPVMSGGCFYDVHENMFLPLFIFSLLYFVEKDNLKGMIVSLCLLLSVKEDAAIYGAFIGIYMILSLKKRKKGILILGISSVYFVIATRIVAMLGAGVMSSHFNNVIYGHDGSLVGIIRTFIQDPALILTQIFIQEKMEFIFVTVGSLMFLSFVTKKWSRLILAGPFILVNLISNYPYLHNIYFQYVFGPGSFLLYLMILNYSDMKIKTRSKVLVAAAAGCFLMFSSTVLQKSSIIKVYNNNKDVYKVIEEGLSYIPKDAQVAASTFFCPALSDRDELYEIYYTDKNTEYVVIDLRYDVNDKNGRTYLKDTDYSRIYYAENIIAVLKK